MWSKTTILKSRAGVNVSVFTLCWTCEPAFSHYHLRSVLRNPEWDETVQKLDEWLSCLKLVNHELIKMPYIDIVSPFFSKEQESTDVKLFAMQLLSNML